MAGHGERCMWREGAPEATIARHAPIVQIDTGEAAARKDAIAALRSSRSSPAVAVELRRGHAAPCSPPPCSDPALRPLPRPSPALQPTSPRPLQTADCDRAGLARPHVRRRWLRGWRQPVQWRGLHAVVSGGSWGRVRRPQPRCRALGALSVRRTTPALRPSAPLPASPPCRQGGNAGGGASGKVRRVAQAAPQSLCSAISCRACGCKRARRCTTR